MTTVTVTEAGASGRYIDLGSPANQDDIGAQTVVVYCKPADQASNIGYYFAKGQSNGNGVRLIQTAGNLFAFGAGSSTATQPAVSQATALTLGVWQHLEATWDGTLNASGIALSVDGTVGSYTGAANGSGSITSDASDNVFLLNRTGLGRHVLGDVAWVARWNRVLNSTELTTVRNSGPLAVSSGLILCFANGQDYGPNAVSVSGRTTQVAGSTPTNTAMGDSSTTTISATPGNAVAAGTTAAVNISVGATVGNAVAAGITASVNLGVTITAAPGNAVANGVTAAIDAKRTITATPGNAVADGVTGSITTGSIALSVSYERSSADLSGSSISGSGDSAIISIRPKMQESEVSSSVPVWMEPSVDVTGLNGFRPTFRFLEYHGSTNGLNGGTSAWFSTRRASYSLDDGVTWNYFDTAVTLDTTNGWVEFRNSTPFAQDKVRIGRSRQISVHQMGDWLAATATAYPSIFVPTDTAAAYSPSGSVSGFAAQAFIADEFTAQTDSLGVTIPVQPLYAAMINDTSLMPADGSPKRIAVITGGVHAGEDSAWWVMRGFINAALGSSTAAQDLRRRYKILIYPMVNAPGRAGGGWRGQWTQGTGGVDDPNRHYDSAGLGLETVSKPKAVITADIGSQTGRDWSIDFHGTYLDGFMLYRLFNNAVYNRWQSLLDTNSPQSVYQTDSYNAGYMAAWSVDSLGFKLGTISETGDPVPYTDTDMEGHGAAMVPTLATMAAEGAFGIIAETGNAVAAGVTATITAAAQTVISATPGDASANGSMASVVRTINASPGDAVANGSIAALLQIISTTPGNAVANGVGASLSTGLTAVFPLPTQVLLGVTYGPTGSDYTGTLTGAYPSAADIAAQVRAELSLEMGQINDLSKIHGLVVGTDLVVTPTSRVAGAILQTITGDGSISTTISRSP